MVTSIEAPFTLLQIAMEMGTFDPVEFIHVALRLIPETLNSIDMIVLINKVFRVFDPAVMKV